MDLTKTKIFDIDFDNLTMEQTVTQVQKIVISNRNTKKKSFVVTPNVDHIVNYHKKERFRNAYSKAALSVVDGAVVLYASKLVRKPLIEKVSGSDLTPKIFELAQKNNFRVFIFGSNPGVADLAIKKIKEAHGYTFPIDTFSPPFGFEKDIKKVEEYVKRINDFNPDILLVSLGSPKGEFFIHDNLQSLNAPISIQIGASIDFIAGTVKRAPGWMQKGGLEWFYRFLQEPKRMFRRYFINDTYFFLLLFKEFFKSSSKKDLDLKAK